MDMRDSLLRCLGGEWPEPGPLNVEKTAASVVKDGYRIEFLSYEAEPGDRVPALLLIPDGVDAGHPAPAVAVWHQHDGRYDLGKSEPAGLAGDSMHYTGVEFAKLGYVVICIDALGFEDRQDASGKLDGCDYERFVFLDYVLQGRSLAWKNILDMRRAIDLLCERPEVDADRIGCFGHSMGSTHVWLVGPFEPRLKCLVANCCLPTYRAIADEHLLHCFANFVPGWSRYGDIPQIVALIAPKALLINLGEEDKGSPIAAAQAGVEHVARVYAEAGYAQRFSSFVEAGTGHVLSKQMWNRATLWMSRHLSC